MIMYRDYINRDEGNEWDILVSAKFLLDTFIFYPYVILDIKIPSIPYIPVSNQFLA